MKVISRRRAIVAAVAAPSALLSVSGAAFGDELTAFRDEVLEVSRRHYPSLGITKGNDVEEVRSGAYRLYLGNLQATIRGLSRDQREVEIVKWIGAFNIQAIDGDRNEAATDAWASAKPLLRPQLVPVEYLEQASMVHRPFFSSLMIGYGLDLGRTDAFVTEPKLSKWGVSLAEVHEAAIANLEAMSEDIIIEPKSSKGGKGRYAAILKGDAYNAPRVLLPKLRTRLIAALGESSVFAGIPNRDFLVAWTPGFSARDMFIAKIVEDSQTQPYPLTADIFRLTPEAVAVATSQELGR